jgi:hypothetical protein
MNSWVNLQSVSMKFLQCYSRIGCFDSIFCYRQVIFKAPDAPYAISTAAVASSAVTSAPATATNSSSYSSTISFVGTTATATATAKRLTSYPKPPKHTLSAFTFILEIGRPVPKRVLVAVASSLLWRARRCWGLSTICLPGCRNLWRRGATHIMVGDHHHGIRHEVNYSFLRSAIGVIGAGAGSRGFPAAITANRSSMIAISASMPTTSPLTASHHPGASCSGSSTINSNNSSSANLCHSPLSPESAIANNASTSSLQLKLHQALVWLGEVTLGACRPRYHNEAYNICPGLNNTRLL